MVNPNLVLPHPFESVDRRFEATDQHFEKIERRVEQRLDAIE